MQLRLFAALLLSPLACAATTEASAAALECDQLPSLLGAFEKNHYSIHDVTPELRARTASKVIEALDPGRTSLLEEEVKRLEKELPATFDGMGRGDCGVVRRAYKLVIERAREDERIARKVLGASYKLDENVELVLDPEKRSYPKTAADRPALIEKMIHFQISSYLLSGLELEAAKKQLIHRYELAVKRLVEDEAQGAPIELFMKQFALAMDPHTDYLTQEDLDEFRIQMQLSLEGIGASLSSDNGVTTIESLVAGGQAEKSRQLQPKDKIIAVAQDGERAVATIDMALRDVVRMIRGKKGTKVTLTILREGAETRTFDVTIVRDKIDVAEQAAKIVYETRRVGAKSYKVGIIDLPSFYGGAGGDDSRSAYRDVKRLLGEARKEKVDGIVLDLSRNGGGLLEDAVNITGLFIKNGGVVGTRSVSGRTEILEDDDDEVAWAGPLVVLISSASASASEILAGALKDYGRAVIAGGESTFGKGSVQVLLPLPPQLGAMKVTTALYFLPGGMSTQHRGVAAHIRVPTAMDGMELGERLLDYSLPPQATEPFLSSTANPTSGPDRWRPVTAPEVAELARRSAERVAQDPGMIELRKEIEEARANTGVVKLAELRKKSKEDAPAAHTKDSTAGAGKTDRQAARDRFKERQALLAAEGAAIAADLADLAAGTRLGAK